MTKAEARKILAHSIDADTQTLEEWTASEVLGGHRSTLDDPIGINLRGRIGSSVLAGHRLA